MFELDRDELSHSDEGKLSGWFHLIHKVKSM